MLIDIGADKLYQLVGHVLASGGRRRLESVVQLKGNVQIHPFDFLIVDSDDRTHLLSSEVSLSIYKYGRQECIVMFVLTPVATFGRIAISEKESQTSS